jgi:preprotein translocase subunit SecD
MYTPYPLWKNLLLIFLVVVGLIYALPNLYSEQPVVQVSVAAGANAVNIADTQQKVRDILTQNAISYGKIDTSDQGLIIHFQSTDQQLLAFDQIKPALGENFTVALNLAPATPSWMNYFNAAPMKQGLDLRGGVHFLLEVDVNSVLTRRYEGLMKGFGLVLRENKIRYIGIRQVVSQGIEIKFRDDAAQLAAEKELKDKYPELLFSAQSDNHTIEVKLSPQELNQIRQVTIEQTIGILRNRVNELGVGEAVVQQQGATRISVDLPGIQDAAHAKQILGGTATLEFRMVDAEHDPMIAKQTGIVPFQSKLYMMDGRPLLLLRQVVLSGDAITSATSSFDQQTASPAVQIQLGGGGEQLFSKVTRQSIGKRMAIVFVENKTSTENINGKTTHTSHREERVISAPVIQSALGNNFQITGLTDVKEAANLSLLLRAGALPAAIYPIEELTVGPSLGKENINRGLISLEVGMALILIVMIIYYRFFGIVADIALFLNLVFLSALMSVIGATLTLPGIAGFVLTVGMAVDANVLINERIREELRLGLSPHAAIQVGYDRAFATIFDSNITTLIVGLVLFAVGSGPVRGFAVILCLGLITSMLTSITYTRAIVNLVYGYRNVKKLSIGI